MFVLLSEDAMGTFISALKRYETDIERVGPTITISGPAASGKSSAAKGVAKRLGMKHVSMGVVFREMASEQGLPLDEFLAKSTADFHERADARQLEYAMRGGVVIEGRLGAWVAGDHAQMRFWLTAPLKERGRRAAGREGLSLDDAVRAVRKRDAIDVDNYKRIYGFDFTSLEPYNYVVSNHLYDLNGTVDILAYLVRKAKRRLPASDTLK